MISVLAMAALTLVDGTIFEPVPAVVSLGEAAGEPSGEPKGDITGPSATAAQT